MTWPRVPLSRVPWVSSQGMRRADAAAQGDYGIEPVQLMEAAGMQVARLVDAWLGGARGTSVSVIAGPGHNGGDALVAARHLLQRGARVRAWVLGATDRLSPLTSRHRRTAEALGIPVQEAATGSFEAAADVVIDGLLGTGTQLPLRGPALAVVAALNRLQRPIVAVDLPSGLDADTGEGQVNCVQAALTLTLGLPKPGLQNAPPVGRLFLADIGLPGAVFGTQAEAVRALYAQNDLLELVSE